ncbi:MAG: CoA activase [Desulfonatronovibrio sp.]
MTNNTINHSAFQERLTSRVGQFDLSGKTLLIPEMAPLGSRFLAAGFRAYGVPAKVMETYTGLNLGKEFTSGKECFPCQVTLGDILYFLRQEKKRLGDNFRPDEYVYFMPEANGPCRFGMYNKLHRIILDKFPEFEDISITYLSTADGYQSTAILPPEKSRLFRRFAYVATIIADVMDRTTWRVRPYEKIPGSTDKFMEDATKKMEQAIEKTGESRDFNSLYAVLSNIVQQARKLIDSDKSRLPRIGIIGEIYLRTHTRSNQDIIREIESHGGEVVDASLGEWINFVTYSNLRETNRQWAQSWKSMDIKGLVESSRKWMSNKIEIQYQLWRQAQAYDHAMKHLDIQGDHPVDLLEKRLDNDKLFNFDIGTEAAISIGGALEYVYENFHGIVNVFPFTCMPSTICSAILKPMLLEKKIPYLDAPYDGSIQPNRDIAIRTFMYQAKQRQNKK